MLRKRRNKLFVILLIIVLVLTGCTKEDNTDAYKFKVEYELYNDSLTKVNIDKDNPIIYTTSEEIKEKIDSEKALVVFYASANNEASRNMVESLISTAKKSGLKKIYYVPTSENETYEIIDTKIETIPTLVSVIKKEIGVVLNSSDNLESLINPVVQELSSCDIDVGC